MLEGKSIASNLNSLEIPRFKVPTRSVRQRYTLLIAKLKEKIKEEEKASDIETDMNNVEKTLEEILEKEADVENKRNIGRNTRKGS